MVINLETANREIAASAATPRGRYGACLLADDSPMCALNASEFTHSHITLSPSNATVEGRMAQGVRIYCMDIADTLLPDEESGIKARGVLDHSAGTQRLRELLESGLETFGALTTPAAYPAAVIGFKSALADLLWQIASVAPGESLSTQQYSTARSLRVFRRARDYIEHRLSDGVSIVELCKEVSVSRRSLEAIFHCVLGIGPSAYVRALQLNRVRRDLLADREGHAPINVIAARHGIWHLSRFSNYYRRMFGELPSQTRRQVHA